MPVDKNQILNTALDLLDAVGLEGLTMRRLAQELKIQAPSLYWHFHAQSSICALADGLFAHRQCAHLHLQLALRPPKWRRHDSAY